MKKIISLFVLSFILVQITNSQTQLGADIDGEAAGDQSGIRVSSSADGSRVAIGAHYNDGNGGNSGQVRVYQYNGSGWVQVGADIDGEAAVDQSGSAVSINADGNRVAVGAYRNDGNGLDSGHVRVYEYNGSAWVQMGVDIDGEAEDDQSGYSVSLSADGNRVAIGAIGNDANGFFSGHVRVYQYNGSGWAQLGDDIDGEAAYDLFGKAVSMSSDGGRVAIGTPSNEGNGSFSGHVRVYQYNGSAWVQMGTDIDGEAANDQSGNSVSMSSDGTRVAIGASNNDGSGANSGHVRVYEYNGSSWIIVGADINGEAAQDSSGRSVSMNADGSLVAISASFNIGVNGYASGHVRVYGYNGSSWVQQGADIDGEAAGDQSWSVSMSADGGLVAIGSFFNDGNGTDSGHVRVYSLTTSNTTPNAICQAYTAQLDASGSILITGANIDGGSYDPDGNTITLSVTPDTFDCDDVGIQTVTLKVTDTNGDFSTCEAIVTVEDGMAPMIMCPDNETQILEAGNFLYELPNYFVTGETTVTDNCTDPVTILSQSPVAGTLLANGTYAITMTAEDEYGNTNSCTFDLTVEIPLGVNENQNNISELVLYPNPFNAYVVLKNSNALPMEKASILDIAGRLLKVIDLKEMGIEKTIYLTDLASATYMILIQGEKGIITKKILKQ